MNWRKESILCGFLVAIFFSIPIGAHAQNTTTEWSQLNQEVLDLTRKVAYERAVLVAQTALQIAEREKGPDHVNALTSLFNLAELYRLKGDYAIAAPLYQRLLSGVEKTFGSNHPYMAASLE